MKHQFKDIIIIIALCVISDCAYSQIYDYGRPVDKQKGESPPISLSLGPIFAIPTKSTPEVENGSSAGGALTFLLGAKSKTTTPQEWMGKFVKPFVGITYGFIFTKGSTLGITNSNSFEVNSKFDAQSNYLGLSGRLQFGKGFFKPFIEAKGGGMHINWNHDVTIKDSTLSNNAILNLRSNGFLYGIGAGFMLGYGRWNFEFKSSFMNSQKLELIDVSTIALLPPNEITYATKEIGTQVILIQIGAVININ